MKKSLYLASLLALAAPHAACAGPVVEPGPSATPEDLDGDGLSNVVEEAGWDILVDGNGYARPGTMGSTAHLETRHVASDPRRADTDGDGLDDGLERRLQSDPGAIDTDGDGVSDSDEVNLYATIPNSVDSDGDARGSTRELTPRPQLFDGEEVARGSSPLLDDTDADGIADYDEIVMGGSHPAVADLPVLDLLLGDEPPAIWLDAEHDERTGTTLSRREQSLTGRETSMSTTDETTNEESLGFKESVEASVGYSGGFEASVTAGFEATQTYTNTSTHSTTRDAIDRAEQEHESALAQETSTGLRYSSGGLAVRLTVRNSSQAISFRVSEVRVLARMFNAETGRMELVGELVPSTGLDQVIAAGDSVDVLFENTALDAGTVLAMLEHPEALTFRATRYRLARVARDGAPIADYAALSESIVRQTGLVVIDYGDGRVERRAIATNVRRNADGSSAGIFLDDALEMAGLPIGSSIVVGEDDRGVSVPVSVRGLSNRFDEVHPERSSYWVVASNDPSTDFEHLVLDHGERVTLMYWQDDDGDQLSNREELLRGTDPNDADTDDDGIIDSADPRPLGEPSVPDDGGDDTTGGGDDGGGGPTFPMAVAHWELGDETMAHTMVPNTLGSGFSLTIQSSSGVSDERDRFTHAAGALNVVGYQNSSMYGYLERAAFPAMATTTIAGWVRGNNNGSSGLIAGRDDGAMIATVDGHAAVRVGRDGPSIRASAALGADWSFVVGTVEQVALGSVRMRLWVNGTLAGDTTVAASLPSSSGTLYLGHGFHGGLDDFRLFDRALTDAEIALLQAEPD